jgi:hypothetical protein
MFLRQPKIRGFDYKPRFYRPEADVGEDGKRRIKFRRLTERKYVQKRPLWAMILVLLILLFLARFFFASLKSDQEQFKFEDLKIEIVE